MKERCSKQANKNYESYGGRGIAVCRQWLDFGVFTEWAVNNGYREGLTIERINNDGNYEPGNCKWATQDEQANNKRNSIKVFINGEEMSLVGLSKLSGISYSTLYSWYKKKLLLAKYPGIRFTEV